MDLSTQRARYTAVAVSMNDYATAARAGAIEQDVTITLTPAQVAECLIALGHQVNNLAFGLELPGDDTSPVILQGLRQMDDSLDAMAVLYAAADAARSGVVAA